MNKENNSEEAKKDDFPGYPHYPAKEDITNAANGADKVPLAPAGGESETAKEMQPDENDNVSKQDLDQLDAAFQNRDLEDTDAEASGLDQTDDEGVPLNEFEEGYDRAGADLDVPGNEDDESATEGLQDEENNYYSLGGDNHTQEEDTNS